MKAEYRSPYLEQLKKKMYLFLLPFVNIAILLGWLLDGMNEQHNFVNHTIFPLLNIWFLIVLFLLIVRKDLLRILEIISFVFITVLYFSWFANLLFNEPERTFTNGGLGEFTNWLPLFFIYLFLIFDRKKALIIGIVLFSFSVVLGIFSFPAGDQIRIRAMDTLIQFYFSTAVYILALYFLQQLKEAFIQNETFKQMVNTDYLTGLPNRRMAESKLDDYCRRKKQIFSIILFDIDLFKEINDRYGHDIGDSVLREFSRIIQENTRKSDLFSRWGGEEFLIIASGQDLLQTILVAERLKNVLESHSFFKVGSVTASFGVAEYRPNEPKEELVKRADISLYKAKEKGRNQVFAHE